MIPEPQFNIWEHTKETLFDLYAKRAGNELSEMTCHKQAVELLAPYVSPGMSVLDAGCGSGYLFWSFYDRGLPVEYYGIDYTASFIDIGCQNIPPDKLPPDRLQVEAIENIMGRFDAVLCINTLFCLPDYRQGVQRLADAARRFLIIRTTLDRETKIRYETDQYLDQGYKDLRAYFNIWAMDEFTEYIDSLGFDVQHVVDERANDQPEISAGKVFPYRVLFCRRREEQE
jgi:SAM-dependent methyltransferase